MTTFTLWYLLYGSCALIATVGVLLAVAAQISAARTVSREWLRNDRGALVRRMLAQLHFLNQRNRTVISSLLLLLAVIGLTQGPPPTIRRAVWMSIAVICTTTVLTTYAAAREWRIRISIRQVADEIALIERNRSGE